MLLGFAGKIVGCGMVALLVACGSDVTPAGDTDGSSDGSTGELLTTSSTSSSESGVEPICMPAERRCAGEDVEEVCSSDGASWVPSPCPMDYLCTECDEEPCGDTLCVGPCETTSSSAGCSFFAGRQLGLTEILGPDLEVPEDMWAPDGLVLVNPNEGVATIQLRELADGSTEPQPVGDPIELAPLEARVVELQDPLPLGHFSTLRIGSLTWVESDRPIVAHAHSPYSPFVGNDSAMLLPEVALGLHYVVPSYPPHYLQFQGAGRPTYFDVIATAPDTVVRWHAQFAGTAGAGAIAAVELGEWSADYDIGRFEGVHVIASAVEGGDQHGADVSGTVVEASAPVWVVAGSRCSAVPAVDTAVGGCDPLLEALVPLEQWGQTYVVGHPPLRVDEDHHYRIYGADEGVMLTTTPPVVEHMFASRGEFVDVVVPNGTNFVVEADGPVMVVGYLASRDVAGELGDPAMYQIVPVEQADVRYVFTAPPDWDGQWVQLVREAGGPDVTLDDVLVDGWEALGAWEVTTVTVAEGVHVAQSEAPFTAIQFAYNNSFHETCAPYDARACHTSYAHPVGMRTERLFDP